MKEAELQHLVTDMLDAHGWRWWHVPAPMVAGRKGEWRPYKKAAGLPDIFAMHETIPRLLILELKGSTGKLTDDQREFLRLARDVSERTWQEPFRDWIDDHGPPITLGGGKAIGVYVIEPSNVDVFEQVLRSKVLT